MRKFPGGQYGSVSLGALVAAMCFTGHAHAQSAQPVAAEPAASAVTEVIVTAQRRSERVRDVPISMTVANAGSMERAGVTDMKDLRLITPGLNIDRQAVHTQPVIRGISAKDASPGNEPAVSVYVDGVYQPVPAALALEFPDVERVEVAKGPQGTLFGRNATGGAISVFTKKPTYEFGGKLSASYGRFDDQKLTGFINLPLIDQKAALSLSASRQRRDGYFNNLFDGEKFGELESDMARGKLLLEPTPWLTVLLTAMYSDRRDDGGVANTILGGNAVGRLTPGTIIPTRPYDVAINPLSTFRVKNRIQSAQISADLGFATLSSITATNDAKVFVAQDDDFTSFSARNVRRYLSDVRYDTFTQEVTLTSQSGGRLSWVGGFFYYDSQAKFRPLYIQVNGVTATRIFGEQYTKAHAFFGEATFAITDQLTAIAGVRLSNERRRLAGHFNAAPDNPDIAHKTFKSTTPRFSLRYAMDPDTNIYFTYSQGFKSGGFNASSLSRIPFDPEKLKAYEVGLKTVLTPTIQLNAAVFYDDYTNQQEKAVVTIAGIGSVNLIANAAASEIYGLEADLTWQLTSDLSAVGGLALLHARYKSFPNATVQLPTKIGGVVCNCGNTQTTVDASGNTLLRAPDYTVSLGLNYDHDYEFGKVELSTSLYYTSSFTFTPDERIRQGGYVNVNARAAYTPEGSPVRFSIWGKNLTDKKVISSTTINPPSDAVIYGEPRTFGVQLDYSF